MKKWYGGVLILALASILVLRYGFVMLEPDEQSTYNFFSSHTNESHARNSDSVEVEGTKPSKKLRLVNVEGLKDLIFPEGIPRMQSKSLLLWPHMNLLLSRSDGLPETAQGVKEASIVWKELLELINVEKTLNFSDVNSSEDKKCPFSVSKNGIFILSDHIVIDLPCGMVEDSSISLVGIPNGLNGGFQFELSSSRISGEPNPPTILHYNVSLPGDNSTEEPFIVQNTWNNELGWGKPEICPANGLGSSKKVDGLVRCNGLVVRSTLEDNLNKSSSVDDILTNVSRASARESANFPFTTGSLFTATLWVGSEGFHMTVNGRHETSFAYGEKFEPWEVSRVKISGGLDLLSILAKGLPVSEDHEFVVDAPILKAPPISRKRLIMLVGVFSTANNFKRRMALRRSWMQFNAVRLGDVAVRFFTGLHKNSQVNLELWREARVFGDIQIMPFVDYYSLITLKTSPFVFLGYDHSEVLSLIGLKNVFLQTKILPAKYIMKTDDDAFVRIDEVLAGLKSKAAAPTCLLYGLMSFKSAPDRDKSSKWYISEKEWPHATYPPWAHGPGYIISRDIAKFIVQGHRDGVLPLFKLEDVAVGIWVQQFKSSCKEINYINDDKFFNAGCESNYVVAHYQSPRLVLCLWEKLQKVHQPICCE